MALAEDKRQEPLLASRQGVAAIMFIKYYCEERWSRQTVNRGDGGSIPPTAVSKLRQFRLHHICLCVSEETLKADGHFYLVSMPGEVKDPTQGVNV